MASMFSGCVSKASSIRGLNRLCKVSTNHNVIQVAFMKRTAFLEPQQKPPPFPYWEKAYSSYLQQMLDPMSLRFDDNTTLITVDGPPAVGKTKFCEKLAAEFGMLYMPPPVHEDLYITDTGYDIRELDPQLPPEYKSFNFKNFLENPNDRRACKFQIFYLLMRMEQYLVAMLHLFSTGQGVILNRSVFSDIAFMQAMVKSGYISNEVFKYYMKMLVVPRTLMPKPHLAIYLDTPVPLVQEYIKKRGKPDEIKSKVLSPKFLSDLENSYKNNVLKFLTNHSKILVYDWSPNSDMDFVVNDIEKVNFDDRTDDILCEWDFLTESEARDKRLAITQFEDYFMEIQRRVDKTFADDVQPSVDTTTRAADILSTIPFVIDPKYKKRSLIEKLCQKEPFHLLYLRKTSRDLINYNQRILT